MHAAMRSPIKYCFVVPCCIHFVASVCRSETQDLIVEISLQPWRSFRPDGVIIFRSEHMGLQVACPCRIYPRLTLSLCTAIS